MKKIFKFSYLKAHRGMANFILIIWFLFLGWKTADAAKVWNAYEYLQNCNFEDMGKFYMKYAPDEQWKKYDNTVKTIFEEGGIRYVGWDNYYVVVGYYVDEAGKPIFENTDTKFFVEGYYLYDCVISKEYLVKEDIELELFEESDVNFEHGYYDKIKLDPETGGYIYNRRIEDVVGDTSPEVVHKILETEEKFTKLLVKVYKDDMQQKYRDCWIKLWLLIGYYSLFAAMIFTFTIAYVKDFYSNREDN